MWCFVYFVLWLVCLLIVWCQQHQSKCYKSICLQWVDRQLAILWQMGLRAPVKFGLHGSISFCNRLLRLYNFHLWLRCLNCESRTFVLDIVWVLVFPWEPLRATLYLYIILWIYDWMVHAVHVHGTCSTYMYIVSCVCMHLLISLIFFVFIMCMWMHSCFEMWFWVWIYLSCGVEILQCPEGWSHPGLGCQKGSSSAHTFSFSLLCLICTNGFVVGQLLWISWVAQNVPCVWSLWPIWLGPGMCCFLPPWRMSALLLLCCEGSAAVWYWSLPLVFPLTWPWKL